MPTVYLGLIQLPDLLHKDKAVGDGVWRDTSVVADQVQIKFLLYQLAQKDAPKR